MPELDLADPFFALGDHIAIDLPGARALFTTRRGGVSVSPYDQLNLGVLTDDAAGAVETNLGIVESEHGFRLAYGRQVHGSAVRVVDGPTNGELPLREADAVATARRGVAPMALAADCLPIALAGPGAVAIVHAGWQGLAHGVIANAVMTLRSLMAGRDGHLAAAIGPGAGVCCYEVGDDLHARFAAIGSDIRDGANLDLKAIARAQLAAAGVVRIDDAGLCTICAQPGLLFSHRRDGGLTGRQAGIVWLT